MSSGEDELQAAVDKATPGMRRAILEAWDRVRSAVTLTVLAAAALGRRMTDTGVLALPGLEADLDAAAHRLSRIFQQQGEMTTEEIASRVRLTMRFDMVNPHAVEAARLHAAAFISNISAETRAAVQTLIVRSVQEGVSYPDLAAILRPMIGLNVRDTKFVFAYRRSLIELGHTTPTVRRLVQTKIAQKVKERALTTAVHELMTHANAGRLAAWRQAVDRGFLEPDARYRWVVTPDERLCPTCGAMAGRTVPIGMSFSPRNPPRHVKCRCTITIDSAPRRR
jgi:hypothetical protein